MKLKIFRNPRKHELILLAILLAGLFLRLYGLGSESLWLDEGYSAVWAGLELPEILAASSFDVQVPLYFIMLHYWVSLFGNSEFSLRFPSFIFGTLSIVLIYRVAALLFNRRVGLLSSLLLALSTFHIYYSQEARAYALMSSLALLSMYFFIRLGHKITRRREAGYTLSSALLIYTHGYGFFTLLSQGAYLVINRLRRLKSRISLRRWFLLQFIVLALFLPWLWSLVNQAIQAQSTTSVISWIPIPSPLSPLISLFEYSGYYLFGLTMSSLAVSIILSLLFLALLVNSTLAFRGRKTRTRKPKHRELLLLWAWLLVPIAIPLIISYLVTPIYWTRYTIASSLAFYILVSRGITNIRTTRTMYLVIALIIILLTANALRYHTDVNKENWRGVSQYLEQHAEPGDMVLFHSGYGRYGPILYYMERTDLVLKPFPRGHLYVNEEDAISLASVIEMYDRVWLVLFHNRDQEGLIKKTLHTELSMVEYRDYVGIELYLFQR